MEEYMWQSRVEIEHYSVVYFGHITRCNTVRTLQVGLIRTVYTHEYLTHLHMSSTPNRSSALQRFERGNAFEIGDGIMFGFYQELPHIE